MSLPSARAGSLQTGIYGQHTSPVDFCEVNYQVTKYIAEFTNTVSNGAYILLGLYGMSKSRSNHLPLRVTLCHFFLCIVGVGSTIFHATMLRSTSVLDQEGMQWLIGILCYCVWQSKPGPRPNAAFQWPLALALAFLCVVTFMIEALEFNPNYFFTLFGLSALVTAYRVVDLLRTYGHKIDEPARTQIVRYFVTGIALILFGFLLWNLDNIFCDDIQPYKDRLGLPTAFLLEGHAYWHLLTALGAYLAIQAGANLCLSIEEDERFDFRAGAFGLPYVIRSDHRKTR